MPLRTIGAEEKEPKLPAPLKGNAHFAFRFETVCELIGVRVVARVFARS